MAFQKGGKSKGKGKSVRKPAVRKTKGKGKGKRSEKGKGKSVKGSGKASKGKKGKGKKPQASKADLDKQLERYMGEDWVNDKISDILDEYMAGKDEE